MVQSASKFIVKNLVFTTENFSSLVLNSKFSDAGQSPVALDDFLFDEESLDYKLGLLALFEESKLSPGNVGVFDKSASRLYSNTLVRTDKESGDIAIVFGDFYSQDVQPNVAILTTDDENNIGVAGCKAKFSLIHKTEIRLDNGTAVKVEVPYIRVENRSVVFADTKYAISYDVPIRFKDNKQPKQDVLNTLWVNGDLNGLKELLGTPFKGGSGGWVPLMSIGDSYRMAGLELPEMELKILNWEEVGQGKYNDEMDLILDPEYAFPVIVSKPSKTTGKMFVARNVTKIRIQQSQNNPQCLYNILKGLKNLQKKDPEKFAKFATQGFKLCINGFDKRNKAWTPDHSFTMGAVTKRVLTPAFDVLLGLTDAPVTDASALPETNRPIDVKAVIASSVDASDPDVF